MHLILVSATHGGVLRLRAGHSEMRDPTILAAEAMILAYDRSLGPSERRGLTTTSQSADPVRFIRRPDGVPVASVIIPSLDGDRSGNLGGLIEDIEQQSFQDFELIVVVGVRPNGRSRNVGATPARGSSLICIDDDMRLGHKEWASHCTSFG